jgi:hypothetical protein
MRCSILAFVLGLGVVGLLGGSAEAGKKVDWSAYLESPSERAASAAALEFKPQAATNAKEKRATRTTAKAKAKAKATKAKAKAKARTKTKRTRRK